MYVWMYEVMRGKQGGLKRQVTLPCGRWTSGSRWRWRRRERQTARRTPRSPTRRTCRWAPPSACACSLCPSFAPSPKENSSWVRGQISQVRKVLSKAWKIWFEDLKNPENPQHDWDLGGFSILLRILEFSAKKSIPKSNPHILSSIETYTDLCSILTSNSVIFL